MTQPYVGQIRPYAFDFAPKGWAKCDGALLSIQQNAALFSLIGTYYGGNGVTTFQLPDLRSRVPMHYDTSYPIGAASGTENVTLTTSNLPSHNHILMAKNSGANARNPDTGAVLASASARSGTPDNFYGPPSSLVALNPASVGQTGSYTPHTNLQPYLAINWCISLYGVFPSRN